MREDLIGHDDFHGAKYYKEWLDHDLSNHYIDVISSNYANIAESAPIESERLLALNNHASWKGMTDIQSIQSDFEITNKNLIKPGVGETTRVLLRRIPWKILVDRMDNPNIKHILLLAKDRNVPVEQYAGLTYSCCGIIKPLKGDAE